MAQAHLRSVIVRVTVDGNEVVTRAVGESMTGVPASTDMHFRNGAVAISYVSTLLLKLVDEKKVGLDDKLSKWLPNTPHAGEVTLRQLAQMTSGYPDYVLGNDAFSAALYADPFRQWTVDDILAQAISKPLFYPPGANWDYAHTNYVLLGLGEGHRPGHANPVAGQRARAAGPDTHGQLRHPRDSRTGSSRIHFGATESTKDPGRHTVLRGVHLLEPVLDHHPRRHPDHDDQRPCGDRVGHLLWKAAFAGVVPGDGVDATAR